MKRGVSYKTSDGKIWYCIGLQKRTPVCASWTGEIKRLSRLYRKGAIESTWQTWLDQHKWFWDFCVANVKDGDFQASIKKILNMKLA